jgi:hypothetical protein
MLPGIMHRLMITIRERIKRSFANGGSFRHDRSIRILTGRTAFYKNLTWRSCGSFIRSATTQNRSQLDGKPCAARRNIVGIPWLSSDFWRLWTRHNLSVHIKGILVAAALLSVGIPRASCADEVFTHPFRVGPLLFRIPRSYVVLVDAREDAPTQGFAIEIRWPSMQGYFSPDGGPSPRETNRQPTIGISYSYYRDPKLKFLDLDSRFKDLDSLDHFVPGPNNVPGLTHYESTATHMPGLDFYFSKDPSVNVLIRCHAPERTLPPLVSPLYTSCTYSNYRNDRVHLTISFRVEYLLQWMDIKRKTEDLLSSFVVGNNPRK